MPQSVHVPARGRLFQLGILPGICFVVCCLAVCVLAGQTSQPDEGLRASTDWPHWRGPRNDNVPVITAFPQDLAKGLVKKWETSDLTDGAKGSWSWSCPSILGDKLVVTGRDKANDTVFCLNAATGKRYWKKEYPASGPDVQYGRGPRATPTIDGDFVYTFGCFGQLTCWRLADGSQVWLRAVKDVGGKMPKWGHASSPLIHGNLVIVQAGGTAQVVALNKKTGEKVWTSQAGPAGYAATMIATVGGKAQLIVLAGDSLLSLNPADGAKLWQMPWPTAYGMNCCTPEQLGDKLLIASFQYNSKEQAGLALLEFGPDGLPKPVWVNHALAGPDRYGVGHNDPVVIDGYFYAYTGFSTAKEGLSCVDMATGLRKWYSTEAGGPGSVLRVGEQLLLLNNAGKLILAKPSPDGFKKISEFDAIGGFPVWTQPVIAHDLLYVRFSNQLICYALGNYCSSC